MTSLVDDDSIEKNENMTVYSMQKKTRQPMEMKNLAVSRRLVQPRTQEDEDFIDAPRRVEKIEVNYARPPNK